MHPRQRFSVVLAFATLAACSEPPAGDPDGDAASDVDELHDAPADGDADADRVPDADDEVGDDAEPDAVADSDPDSDSDGDGPCDLVTGLGCGFEEKCGIYTPDSAHWEVGCVPLLPGLAAEAGGACTLMGHAGLGVADNCPGGYICMLRPGGEYRACEKLCSDGGRDACLAAYPARTGPPRDGICIYDLERDVGVPDLMACTLPGHCSPTCQTCRAGPSGVVGCYVASDGLTAGPVCALFDRTGLAGGGVTADPCRFVNNCAPGYHCQAGECRAYCDPRLTFPDGEDVCEFALCELRTEPGVGTCGVPAGADPEAFSLGVGLGLCIEG